MIKMNEKKNLNSQDSHRKVTKDRIIGAYKIQARPEIWLPLLHCLSCPKIPLQEIMD